MRTSWRVVRGRYESRADNSRWRRHLTLALASLALATACVSPGMRDDDQSGTLTIARGAPAWVGQPLDWGKLERIDRWLDGDARHYDGYWRVQAELTLGEGRLTFARKESSEARMRSKPWLARIQGARSGFQRVLADPAANEPQMRRARQALDEIDRLRGATTLVANEHSGPYLPRSTWNALAPIPSRLDPTIGGYDRITIHHTANVPGVRFDGSLADSIQAIQKVQRNHIETRAYGDIGYHFLIDADGRVFDGRELRYQGAHAGGMNNVRNIGVCLIGNFERSRPSPRAMAALDQVLAQLRFDHSIARTRIVGHGELKSTACPGVSLRRWVRDYRTNGPVLSLLRSQETFQNTQAVPASMTLPGRDLALRPVPIRSSGARTGSVVR